MMIDALIAALGAEKSIADWRITEKRRAGEESFFVGQKLDMRRKVEKLGYELVVYVDGKMDDGSKSRGMATVNIHPTMDRAEVEAAVRRAATAASRSRNPWYALPEKAPARIELAPSSFEGRDIAAVMRGLAAELYSGGDKAKGSRINSLELFLSREEIRILNSRGVDAGFAGYKGYVEFTVESASPSGPVELTDFFSFSDAEPGRLAAEIGGRLSCVADRAVAGPTPASPGLPLILTGANAEAVMGWFFENLNSAKLYTRASPFVLGESVQGPAPTEAFTIRAEAALGGASRSAPFDAEGTPLGSPLLCEKGIARAFCGPSRYASYLGLAPLGSYELFSVEGGSMPAAELRSRPHVEAAFFSDFTVDGDSGDFGGEIRLAYISDGKTRKPVTGGSITGSLFENRGAMRLSKETSLVENMLGPEAILLPRVSVTPAE